MTSPLKARLLLPGLVDLGLVPASRAEFVEAVSPSTQQANYSETRSALTAQPVLRRQAPQSRPNRAASGRTSRLTTRELEQHLRSIGCAEKRQKGSHVIWATPAGRTFPVPCGSGRRGGDSVTSAVLLVVRRVLREEGLQEPARSGDEG